MQSRQGHLALLRQQMTQLGDILVGNVTIVGTKLLEKFVSGEHGADAMVAKISLVETALSAPLIAAIRDMAYNIEGRPVVDRVRAFQFLHETVSVVPLVAQFDLGAFFGCRLPTVVDLRGVHPTFKASVFEDTTGMETLYLSSSVGRLPPRFCSGSAQLSAVHAPGVQIVANSAFEGCGSLHTLVSSRLCGVDDRAFFGCVALEIGSESLEDCVYIGASAFEESGLRAVEGLLAVVFVGCAAFRNARRLVVVNGIAEAVPDHMCTGCTSLATAHWPRASQIGRSAFECCGELRGFRVASDVELSTRAFSRSGLVTLDLQDAVLRGTAHFENCRDLQQLRLGATITRVPHKLCRGCTALTRLVLSGAWAPRQRVILNSGNCATVTKFHGVGKVVVLMDDTHITAEVCVDYCTALPSFLGIGCESFAWCHQLEVIDLWPTETIRSRAFYRSGLTQFRTNAQLDVNCCAGSQDLRLVVLPTQARIPAHSFLNCTQITQLVTVATVFGPYSFCGCTSLVLHVDMPHSMAFVGARAFSGTQLGRFVVGKGSYVGPWALASTNKVNHRAEVEIGANSKLAGQALFESGAHRIWIGSATTVGKHAFQKCPFLVSAVLHTADLRPAVFSDCRRLTTVALPYLEVPSTKHAVHYRPKPAYRGGEVFPKFQGRLLPVRGVTIPSLFCVLFGDAQRCVLRVFVLALTRWAKTNRSAQDLPQELLCEIFAGVYYRDRKFRIVN